MIETDMKFVFASTNIDSNLIIVEYQITILKLFSSSQSHRKLFQTKAKTVFSN